MKKRFYSFVTAAALTAAMLTGCGSAVKGGGAASSTASYDMAAESAAEYAAGAVVAEENGAIWPNAIVYPDNKNIREIGRASCRERV